MLGVTQGVLYRDTLHHFARILLTYTTDAIVKHVNAHLRSVVRLLGNVKVLQTSRKRGARPVCFAKWEQTYECLLVLQESKEMEFVQLGGAGKDELPTPGLCDEWIREVQLAIDENRVAQLSQGHDARAAAMVGALMDGLTRHLEVRVSLCLCDLYKRTTHTTAS